MLEGRADIAVHSMKDVPVEFPEGLGLDLCVICEREDPRDAFVSNHVFTPSLAQLPPGSRGGAPPACAASASCAPPARIW